MTMRVVFCGLWCASLMACAGGGIPSKVIAKPGVTLEQRQADYDQCSKAASDPNAGEATRRAAMAGAQGDVVAGGAVGGFAAGWEKAKAQQQARNDCLGTRGYVIRDLSDAEKASIEAASADNRVQAIHAIASGPAVTPAPVRKPVTPKE